MNFTPRKLLAPAAAALLCLSAPAPAGPADFKAAETAYESGNYTETFRLLLPEAGQGDAVAQYLTGVKYMTGDGVPQDYGQALTWFRKAAEQGAAIAQITIGAMYFSGEGVPQDFAQAFTWYRKAAEQGVARAQYSIGTMYALGKGVQQDFGQARFWLQKAAQNKNQEARNAALSALNDLNQMGR
ncbi:tetratricopeptide repeat protein [Neisseria leonii]|uniref:tetratricopeptide repeat protein n=1 Tax=Neisseria leonii TaxID=2995413 RepID=UPI0030CD2303